MGAAADIVNKGVKVFAYPTEPEDGRSASFSTSLGTSWPAGPRPDLLPCRGRRKWCLMAAGHGWERKEPDGCRLGVFEAGLDDAKMDGFATGKVLKLEPIAKNPDDCYPFQLVQRWGPSIFYSSTAETSNAMGSYPPGASSSGMWMKLAATRRRRPARSWG